MALQSCKQLRLVYRFYSRGLTSFNRKFSTESSSGIDEEEFRVLELYPMKKDIKKTSKYFSDAQVLPPREKRMPIDQDWPSVWPTAKSFRPSVVPLPIHQGYRSKRISPGKYANAELMKIPNFLHLTPPAIKRHCGVLKAFCTDWPQKLDTDEACMEHFPVEIISSDYCHSSPTIRDERSRIVTLRIKLNSLKLDYHARDKLLRLIGKERYDGVTDIVTIVADRCPLRQQNYDYLLYLLTAIHHESWITEPWEHEKTEADMEKFFFEGSRIENNILQTFAKIKSLSSPEENISEEALKQSAEVENYGKAVTQLLNEGENNSIMNEYKQAVMKALNLESSRCRSLI